MRRSSPPPSLRVATFTIPAIGRVAPGSGGLGIGALPVPDGLDPLPGVDLRLVRGAPFPAEHLVVVNGGALTVSLAGGVARSLRLPDVVQAFDRRPPGLVGLVGAPLANACCLIREDGWSAVVLPSLGDIGSGSSSGSVALRADGLRVAAIGADGITEHDLASGGATVATHPGAFRAVAFDHEGALLCSLGAAIGAPDAAAVEGSPVVAIAAAAEAPVAVTAHEDGSYCAWNTETLKRMGTFTSPVGAAARLAISSDGGRIGLSGIDRVALHYLPDGRLGYLIENAVALVPDPRGEGFVIGGVWGTALAIAVEVPA